MLLVLVLTGALLASAAGTVRHDARLVRAQRAGADVGDAVLTVRAVLRGELRWAEPRTDLALDGPGALTLRAARGLAIVCRRDGDDLVVRYRGLRVPEPAKDSVLGIGDDRAAGLRHAARAPGACPVEPGETAYLWRLDEPARAGAFLLFESGSYHLADSAFRYRRGRSGRQPLTPEVFRKPRFQGANGAEGGLLAVTTVLPAADSTAPRRATAFLANATTPDDSAASAP